MRILYLAHRVPYPPNKGDKIRSYHHVRYLAQRHEVHLMSFVDEVADEAGASVLREHCAGVTLVPLSKKVALVRGAWALARGQSLSEGYFGSRAMHRAVVRAVAQHPFDVAWAFSSVMAQYLPVARAPRNIADFVDVDSEKWQQYADHSQGLRRWGFRLEAKRLRAFERQVGARVDEVLLVSAAEAELLAAFCPRQAAVRVIPNGVDTAYFKAVPSSGHNAVPTLLFTGALDYRPNIDAVLFAAREVLPLVRREIPNARLLAVGHRPARDLLRQAAAHRDALSIAGSVPDVRPYFRQAHVYIAPLRLGRGVQNKILEAMAMRLPVIATPVAVAGLAIDPGRHAFVCTLPDELAAAVIALMRDERCHRALAEAAVRLIAERYDWAENLKLLDTCVAKQSDAALERRLPQHARRAWRERALSYAGVDNDA